MELIERISALEGEVKLVKSEIKKVLVDLREAMDTAENPFTYLEQLRGGSGIDEERLKQMEAALEEIKELGGGNGIEEERIKNLEDTLQELKELGDVEVERLQNLEDAIAELREAGAGTGAETEAEPQSEKPVIHNPAVSESELNEFGVGFGAGAGIGTGSEVVDTVTLAQLMQWVDRALNLIGMEKLNQIVELYALTGRISEEMKDTILKVAELPDPVLNPEKGNVETKHCIIALCELDRILTGEHQELFGLLKELCNVRSPLKNPDVKHSQIQIQTKSQSPAPAPAPAPSSGKTEKEKRKITSKPKKNG